MFLSTYQYKTRKKNRKISSSALRKKIHHFAGGSSFLTQVKNIITQAIELPKNEKGPAIDKSNAKRLSLHFQSNPAITYECL
jgi:hypothetical protein